METDGRKIELKTSGGWEIELSQNFTEIITSEDATTLLLVKQERTQTANHWITLGGESTETRYVVEVPSGD